MFSVMLAAVVQQEKKAGCSNQDSETEHLGQWTDQTNSGDSTMRQKWTQPAESDKGDGTLLTRKKGQNIKTAYELHGSTPEIRADKV